MDITKLTGLLLDALADPSPVVRARALCVLSEQPLSDQITATATPLLSDSNWLCRLAAIELFAGQHRQAFLPVLERLSQDDHPLVADLARLYRDLALSLQPQHR